MAVVLPNCALRAEVRAHPAQRDARGKPVASAQETPEVRGPYPGAVVEPDIEKGPEGGGWRIRADIRLGPLSEGDALVREEDGVRFVIRSARAVQVPGCDAVDFIRITADRDPILRT